MHRVSDFNAETIVKLSIYKYVYIEQILEYQWNDQNVIKKWQNENNRIIETGVRFFCMVKCVIGVDKINRLCIGCILVRF